jgi:chromosome segregation ATPase
MTCGIKDFHEENRERIEKNKRELVILNARLANLSGYAELLERKIESLQADLRKAFLLIWLMLILFLGILCL